MPAADRAAPALAVLGDGRSARSARTRRAIVDALLHRLDRGDLRPTAERIAATAGVSVRSIFQHFADIESLFAEAAVRHGERIAARMKPIPVDAPLRERLGNFVLQRTRLYESIAGVARAAHLQEPFSNALRQTLHEQRSASRREIARVFGPELHGRSSTDRRELLDALNAGASWSLWESLRSHQRLSSARARRVVLRTLGVLLGLGRSVD